MQTTACWLIFPDEMETRYEREPFKNAMIGLTHLIRAIIPLHLMCAPKDINVVYHVRDGFTVHPTIYIYDSVPGGIGLSDRVYEMIRPILERASEMLNTCPCTDGCPSCVGASAGPGSKKMLKRILIDLQKEYPQADS